MGTFLFNSFSTDKTRLVPAVIGGNDKIDTPVDAHHITDVRNITFLDIIGYRYMQKILTVFIYKLGSTKLIDFMVKILRQTFSKIRQLYTPIQGVY